MSEWRWRPWLVGWVAHTAAFTAVVFYERQQRQEAWLPAIAALGAADASRFAVAIAGPAWPGRGADGHVERYTIRGTLDEVRAKLVTALERRQRAYNTPQQEVADAA